MIMSKRRRGLDSSLSKSKRPNVTFQYGVHEATLDWSQFEAAAKVSKVLSKYHEILESKAPSTNASIGSHCINLGKIIDEDHPGVWGTFGDDIPALMPSVESRLCLAIGESLKAVLECLHIHGSMNCNPEKENEDHLLQIEFMRAISGIMNQITKSTSKNSEKVKKKNSLKRSRSNPQTGVVSFLSSGGIDWKQIVSEKEPWREHWEKRISTISAAGQRCFFQWLFILRSSAYENIKGINSLLRTVISRNLHQNWWAFWDMKPDLFDLFMYPKALKNYFHSRTTKELQLASFLRFLPFDDNLTWRTLMGEHVLVPIDSVCFKDLNKRAHLSMAYLFGDRSSERKDDLLKSPFTSKLMPHVRKKDDPKPPTSHHTIHEEEDICNHQEIGTTSQVTGVFHRLTGGLFIELDDPDNDILGKSVVIGGFAAEMARLCMTRATSKTSGILNESFLNPNVELCFYGDKSCERALRCLRAFQRWAVSRCKHFWYKQEASKVTFYTKNALPITVVSSNALSVTQLLYDADSAHLGWCVSIDPRTRMTTLKGLPSAYLCLGKGITFHPSVVYPRPVSYQRAGAYLRQGYGVLLFKETLWNGSLEEGGKISASELLKIEQVSEDSPWKSCEDGRMAADTYRDVNFLSKLTTMPSSWRISQNFKVDSGLMSSLSVDLTRAPVAKRPFAFEVQGLLTKGHVQVPISAYGTNLSKLNKDCLSYLMRLCPKSQTKKWMSSHGRWFSIPLENQKSLPTVFFGVNRLLTIYASPKPTEKEWSFTYTYISSNLSSKKARSDAKLVRMSVVDVSPSVLDPSEHLQMVPCSTNSSKVVIHMTHPCMNTPTVRIQIPTLRNFAIQPYRKVSMSTSDNMDLCLGVASQIDPRIRSVMVFFRDFDEFASKQYAGYIPSVRKVGKYVWLGPLRNVDFKRTFLSLTLELDSLQIMKNKVVPVINVVD